MSYQNENTMEVLPGIEDYIAEGDDEITELYVRSRVGPAYKRKLGEIQRLTGMNESEIIRKLIERAIVYTVIKRSAVLGVQMNEGSDPD